MTGDATGCKEWGESYDKAAHHTLQVSASLADALTNYDTVFYCPRLQLGNREQSDPPPPAAGHQPSRLIHSLPAYRGRERLRARVRRPRRQRVLRRTGGLMGADEAPRAIVEHEDRWLFKPLRGRTVTRIEWKSDHLELVLDDDHFRILVGYDTELSARSLAKGSPDRHRIDHWNRVEVEEFLGRGLFRPCSSRLERFAWGSRMGGYCSSTPTGRISLLRSSSEIEPCGIPRESRTAPSSKFSHWMRGRDSLSLHLIGQDGRST